MLRDWSWFQPSPLNFPVAKRRRRMWRRWAKRYQATSLFKLLKQIEAEREHRLQKPVGESQNYFWLLPFRARLRRIIAACKTHGQQGEAAAIRYYLAYCPPGMIPICVWLIGKCCDRFHSYPISEICRHQSAQYRKHIAKALKRLEEWWMLEDFARLYPDDATVQRIAAPTTTHRPFRQRLLQYSRLVDDSHAGEVATPSHMPYWARDDQWERTPPKSVLFIRRMLRRIQHLVRWGVS
jgi:hypothetical protein